MIRFEDLIAKATNRPNHIKAIFASLESILTLIIWLSSLYFCARFVLAPLSLSKIPSFGRELNFAIYLILFGFLIPLTFLILWRGFVMGLKPISIFNYGTKFRFWLFLSGFLIAASIILGLSLFSKDMPLSLILARFGNFEITQIFILLPIYIIAFSIQSTFEEAFFRATLVQNLRALGAHIFIAIGISAMIFAIFHLSSKTSPIIFFATFIMGIAFSITTLRTNGIEMAMGAHIANNIIIGALFGQFDNSQNSQAALFSAVLFFGLYLALAEVSLWLCARVRPH